MVYLPTFIVDFYGLHVGEYAIHGYYGEGLVQVGESDISKKTLGLINETLHVWGPSTRKWFRNIYWMVKNLGFLAKHIMPFLKLTVPPENEPSQRKVVSQPALFRGCVSFSNLGRVSLLKVENDTNPSFMHDFLQGNPSKLTCFFVFNQRP